jgi:galactose-1-phosphate uridylyltransferase
MKVDKELLKKEKMIYGDDFTPVCESWSMYLGVKITPKDVAMMMAQMKETRIKFIQNKLNDLKDKPNFLVDNNYQELYKIFKSSLDDNNQKKAHYLFIATNFDEYKNL